MVEFFMFILAQTHKVFYKAGTFALSPPGHALVLVFLPSIHQAKLSPGILGWKVPQKGSDAKALSLDTRATATHSRGLSDFPFSHTIVVFHNVASVLYPSK